MSDDAPAIKRLGGRPPLPPGQALTEIIGSFRATRAEADALDRFALKSRKSTRRVLREYLQYLQRREAA